MQHCPVSNPRPRNDVNTEQQIHQQVYTYFTVHRAVHTGRLFAFSHALYLRVITVKASTKESLNMTRMTSIRHSSAGVILGPNVHDGHAECLCASGCGRVPNLQSGGCRFEYRPTQPSIPLRSVNEYQL